MGEVRLLILIAAAVLVLLSISPLRRRLPGFRSVHAGLELLLWTGFVFLCVTAVARIQDLRQTELRLAMGRAMLTFAGQAVGSALEPAVLWVSAHQPGLSLVTVGAVGIGWVCVVARAATIFARAQGPRPRLGDWWVLGASPGDEPRLQELPAPAIAVSAPPIAVTALLDVQAAAVYLGVSQATVYRWVRAGRLRRTHAGTGLRFSADDLAAMRHRGRRSGGPRKASVA